MPRVLATLVIAALLVAFMPVDRVRAEELPPEVKEGELTLVPEDGERSATTDGDEPDEVTLDDDEEAASSEGDAEPAAIDDGWVTSEVSTSSFPFTMIGFRGTGQPELVFRTADADTWSEWIAVEFIEEIDGPDPGSAEEAQAELVQDGGWVSEPVWVSEANAVQVRMRGGSLDDVDVVVIDSMGLSESLWKRVSRTARSFTTAQAEASSGPPGVVTRKQWGADESLRKNSPSYRTPQLAVLHHTAGSNSYTRAEAPGIVRGIYAYHTRTKGWNDIGYNFLVDRYGTVYEGRFGGMDRGVVGAHASGWNSGSFGVSIMGNFDVASPPAVAVKATSDVIAWKYAVHGINPAANATVNMNNRTVPRLVGHRDVGSTACPGRFLYSMMGSMRNDIETEVTAMTSAWVPVVGDWNGNGRETAGWFDGGRWRLASSNSTSASVSSFTYGRPGDIPVVGDWNGDGIDTVGIVRDGTWHLKLSNTSGHADISFTFGRVTRGDIPLVGDWNGNGRDTIGIVRDGQWHLRNSLSSGPGQIVFTYGRVTRGDVPLVGDWNRDGIDTAGIVRDGAWHLRNSHTAGHGEVVFTYGRVTQGDRPSVGDWNGNGHLGVAVTRHSLWYTRDTLSGGPAQSTFTIY